MKEILLLLILLISSLNGQKVDTQIQPQPEVLPTEQTNYNIKEIESDEKETVSRGSNEHIITIPKYDIPMPLEHQVYIYQLCEEKGIEYELILGMIQLESNFDANLVCHNSNKSVDRGYMQINSCREKELKNQGYTDLLDPYQNLEIGINIIADLLNRYEEEHIALSCYNKGENGFKKNYANKGIYQTAYSQRVIEYKNNFKEGG